VHWDKQGRNFLATRERRGRRDIGRHATWFERATAAFCFNFTHPRIHGNGDEHEPSQFNSSHRTGMKKRLAEVQRDLPTHFFCAAKIISNGKSTITVPEF